MSTLDHRESGNRSLRGTEGVTIIAFLQEGSPTKSRNLQRYTNAGGNTYRDLAVEQDSQLRVFLLKQFAYLPIELRLVRMLESRIQNRFCESRL